MKKLVCESLYEFRELQELDEDWKDKVKKGLIGAAMVGSLMGGIPKQAQAQTQMKEHPKMEQVKEIEKKMDNLASAGNYDATKPLAAQRKTLLWEITLSNPYWKGKPYEKIINELAKSYDLNDIDKNDNEIAIFPANNESGTLYDLKYNMEDANKIKNIITKILGFEPQLDKKWDTLIWTTSKYNVELFKTGSNDIRINFITN